MDIEKLIEQLKYYGTTYAIGDNLGKEIDGSDELMLNAATVLSTLQAENEKLRVEAEGMRSNWYKSVEEIKKLRAATALSTLQAENSRLRAELEYEREHANAYYQECGQWEAENEKLRADVVRLNDLLASYQNVLVPELRSELEQVTLENNALWTYIEIVDGEYRRYMDRGYIDRLDELKKVWKHGQGGRA